MILTPEIAKNKFIHPISYPGIVAATTKDILATIANHFKIEVEELTSDYRHGILPDARKLTMSLLHYNSRNSGIQKPYTLMEIGEILGGRDHSTTIWACKKSLEYIQYDRKFKNNAMQVCQMLNIDFNLFKKHLIDYFSN